MLTLTTTADKHEAELDEIERRVGSAIQALRKMRGLTRKELADILHVSHQQIAKYENAQNRITAGKLYLLAQKFNVSIDYFFNKDEVGNSGAGFNSRDRDQIEVARNYMSITSFKKREAVRFLTKILAEDM